MTTSEAAFFEENGYLILRQAVVGAQLADLTAELAAVQQAVESGLWRGNHLFEEEGVARVIFNPYDHSPTLRRVIASDAMLGRARVMLKSPLRLDHTKLMCKVAGRGSAQPPHQDYYYWQANRANQVAVFVCIDPSTEANGCLRLFPGSHTGGLLPHHEEYHAVSGERHWVCDLPSGAVEVPFIAEPGDAIFFGSLTIHRSESNRSAQSRRAVIFEYDELNNLPEKPGWGGPLPAVRWTMES